MVRLGIVSAHGPVLLAWAVLRHAALDDMGRAQTQHLGKTAIQLQTMHFLSDLLQDPGFSGTTNVSANLTSLYFPLFLFPLISAFINSKDRCNLSHFR